jgi:hypothetical protein
MLDGLIFENMNRLNQTEPATFSILPCLAFFMDSYFLYFNDILEIKKAGTVII